MRMLIGMKLVPISEGHPDIDNMCQKQYMFHKWDVLEYMEKVTNLKGNFGLKTEIQTLLVVLGNRQT